MRKTILLTILAAATFVPSAIAGQTGNDWAGGIGTVSCEDFERVANEQLDAWVFGYWTGANLYLGGGDLCEERADISDVTSDEAVRLVRDQCQLVPQSPIMMAAFNALKGMPKVPGSRAAKCEEG